MVQWHARLYVVNPAQQIAPVVPRVCFPRAAPRAAPRAVPIVPQEALRRSLAPQPVQHVQPVDMLARLEPQLAFRARWGHFVLQAIQERAV